MHDAYALLFVIRNSKKGQQEQGDKLSTTQQQERKTTMHTDEHSYLIQEHYSNTCMMNANRQREYTDGKNNIGWLDLL